MRLPTRFILTLLFALQWLALSSVTSAASLEDINALEQTITQKQQRLNNFQQQLIQLDKKNRNLQRDISSVNIDLKQLNRQRRKLESMSSTPPSEADKKQLSTITYKRRVSEIAQEKNHNNTTKIAKDQKKIKQSITRLDKLLLSLNTELSNLNEAHANSKEAKEQAAKEARSKRIAAKRLKKQQQKIRQQQAAAKKHRQTKHKKQRAEKAKKQTLKNQQFAQQQQEKQQQAEADMLLKKTAGLPQDEAALIRAQHIAQKASTTAPSLGNAPLLKLANPTGSKPKKLVQMQHLGNHQYSATIQVKKGRQQYSIGKHTFDKSIPKQFSGLTCLILIDARTEQPTFQLIAKGRR